ncbi:hypothetical protein [Marinobacter sp. CHS3-4]|uniref:hypothetical protein n=1 Tax=Marinobacter sp. CHS3-4 TaxID=3045174 RepID=UPI0024B4C549|nr:hypothetical protein [Marinobacter sp. CHS3-4]MDI9244537.1 hypothetical protein [Marinobacter sp. CHS3-4]
MPRKRHSNKDIEDALTHAESQGWRIEKGRGHAWGRMYCPFNDADCRCGEFCVASIWSTPKNAQNHAKQIRRIVDNCTGDQRSGGEDHES